MFKLVFVSKTQVKQRGAVYSGTHLSPSTQRTEAGGLEFQLDLDYRGAFCLKKPRKGVSREETKAYQCAVGPPRSSLGVFSPCLPHLK